MSRLVFALLALAVACEAARLHSKRGLLAKKRLYARQHRQMNTELVMADPDTANTGVISSPNYPNYYPAYQDLGWVISAPEGQTVSIMMDDFALESHYMCIWDWLKIYDGLDESAELLGTYCGGSAANLQLTSSTNNLFIAFHSDYCVQAPGFSLTWAVTGTVEFAEPEESACPGPLELTEEGEISSENYGVGTYTNYLNCAWRITAPAGKMVALLFSTFSVENGYFCYYDALRVYDGTSSEAEMLANLCGSELPGPILSSANEMTLTFTTDYSVVSTGFLLDVYFVDSQDLPDDLLIDTSPAPVASGECPLETVDVTDEALIETPNMATGAAEYDNYESCKWTVTAPEGERVMLEFISFHLEQAWGCIYDSLIIHDGPTEASPAIAVLCGYLNPPNLYSSGQSLHLVFTSDYSVTEPGFSIMASFTDEPVTLMAVADTQEACNDTTEITEELVIQSPNFGFGSYPNDAECRWLIHNTDGLFAVEYHSNCAYDALEIYEGNEPVGDPMFRLCGYTVPTNITSTAPEVLLVFTSDFCVTDSGFRIEVIFGSTTTRSKAGEKRMPVPGKRMPAPEKRMPAPEKRMPAPEKRMPAPEKRMPAPEKRMPAPEKRMPAPEKRMPAPEKRMPAPEKRMPAPEKRMPAPEKRMPAPEKRMPESKLSRLFKRKFH